jgi:hypothetical protein
MSLRTVNNEEKVSKLVQGKGIIGWKLLLQQEGRV